MKTVIQNWLSHIRALYGRLNTLLGAKSSDMDNSTLESGKHRLSEFFTLCKSVHARFISDLEVGPELNNVFRKFLVVAAASRLEAELQEYIVSMLASGNETWGRVLFKLIKQRPGEVFSLDANGAKKFYKQFGPQFAAFMEAKEAKEDSNYAKNRRNFALIVKARHGLVHGDIVSNAATNAMPEWDIEEVEKRFASASKFLLMFRTYALEFMRKQSGGNPPPTP